MRALAPAWPPIGAAVEHDDAAGPRRRRTPRSRARRARRRRRRRRTARRARACRPCRGSARARLGRVEQHRAVGAHDQRRRRGAAPYCSSSAARVRHRSPASTHVVRHGRCGAGSSAAAAASADCGSADQHRAARAGLDQRDAAQDQRAHDALAEIGLGDDQRAQLLAAASAAPRRPRRASPSTSAGRPDSCADLARGTGPAPARTIGTTWPRPSRWRDRDDALRARRTCRARLAGREQALAAWRSARTVPKRRMRSISASRQHREHLLASIRDAALGLRSHVLRPHVTKGIILSRLRSARDPASAFAGATLVVSQHSHRPP